MHRLNHLHGTVVASTKFTNHENMVLHQEPNGFGWGLSYLVFHLPISVYDVLLKDAMNFTSFLLPKNGTMIMG